MVISTLRFSLDAHDARRVTVIHLVKPDERTLQLVGALSAARGLPVHLYGDAVEFLTKASSESHGCLICDLEAVGWPDLGLFADLHGRRIVLPVIVLSGDREVATAVRVMQAGAFSFLSKPVDEGELRSTTEQALRKQATDREERERQRQIAMRLSQLNPEEVAVMKQVLQGLPNKRIAKSLSLGLRTVELRRSKVMKKMQARSLPELVRMAMIADFPF